MRKVYSRVAYACKPSLMRRAAPDPDHAGQVQAFGIADLGMGAGLGYISIPELLENGAELDIYYTTPKTIGELLAYCSGTNIF